MEILNKYSCENCGYYTNISTNFKTHIASKKHLKIEAQLAVNDTNNIFQCDVCNKKFISNSGFWSHKRGCKIEDRPVITDYNTIKEINESVREIKQNMPLIQPQQILNHTITTDNSTDNSTSSSTNNTQNNNFNITMYLNENCKDAIDFMSLIRSIEIGKDYREKMLANGFAQNICDVIKETLNKIPFVQRPIHYIENEDPNQQIIHIRDNNEWKKETELEWTSQIHNYYSGEFPDDTPEPEKAKIFFGLKELEENIIQKITEYYSKSIQFKIFERDNQSEMNYVPNKIKIIKYLLENIKLDKNELVSLIEKSDELIITNEFV